MRIEPGLWQVASEVTAARGANLPRAGAGPDRGAPALRRELRHAGRGGAAGGQFPAQQRDGHCSYRGFSLRDGPDARADELHRRRPARRDDHRDGRPLPPRAAYDAHHAHDLTGMPDGANMVIETRTLGRRIGALPAGTGGSPAKELTMIGYVTSAPTTSTRRARLLRRPARRDRRRPARWSSRRPDFTLYGTGERRARRSPSPSPMTASRRRAGNGNMAAIADGQPRRRSTGSTPRRSSSAAATKARRACARRKARGAFYGAYFRDLDGNKLCVFRIGPA